MQADEMYAGEMVLRYIRHTIQGYVDHPEEHTSEEFHSILMKYYEELNTLFNYRSC
jgi:hypothetical protein